MSKEIKDAAQQQAEESFDGFMYWMKKGTIISCIFLAIVVVGCNSELRMIPIPLIMGSSIILAI